MRLNVVRFVDLSVNNALTLIQIASQKTGTHRSMHSSILFHPSTTLATPLDVFMCSSAMQRPVKVKG